MARRGRNNGGRGRNRGSAYARPIAEPCNFLEVETTLSLSDGQVSLTHQALNALLVAVVPVTSISKYRVSSLVIDQLNSSQGAIASAEITMGISGNTYVNPNSSRPLKMRFSKDYGNDGMWFVTDAQQFSVAALPGNEALNDPFLTIEANNLTGTVLVELHIRFAWQDPS